MPNWKNSAGFKIIFIGILMLILLIPIGMILGVIYERESTYDEAIAEISGTWGGSQTIIGPILVIPYSRTVRREDNTIEKISDSIQILPKKLGINSQVETETRSRGIYNATGYTSTATLEGEFNKPDYTNLKVSEKELDWNNAQLILGISDIKGLQESIGFALNGNEEKIDPSPNLPTLNTKGVIVKLKPQYWNFQELSFKTDITIRGTEELKFAPIGETNTMRMTSPWKTPGFIGDTLPKNHTITQEGFSADWNISYLTRSYPQQWNNDDQNDRNERLITEEIELSAVGTKFYQSVELYQKNTRALKYGELFIALTFAAFFLFEILSHLRLHPIQYLLVGLSMCVFYLLTLAFSEHLRFGLSYLISSTATISLITFYSYKIMKNNKEKAAMMAGLFIFIYVFLYIILQLQDYALLVGSIAIFATLTVFMILTRNIDWFNPQITDNENKN